eukprot:6207139-Pleurochrysis_carterae.AAC.1
MHGRGGGGRAAAVHFRRVGECGLHRPRRVVGRFRNGRIISFARTASKGGGTKVLIQHARGGVAPARIADRVHPQQRGMRQTRSALSGENATRPASPRVLVTS